MKGKKWLWTWVGWACVILECPLAHLFHKKVPRMFVLRCVSSQAHLLKWVRVKIGGQRGCWFPFEPAPKYPQNTHKYIGGGGFVDLASGFEPFSSLDSTPSISVWVPTKVLNPRRHCQPSCEVVHSFRAEWHLPTGANKKLVIKRARCKCYLCLIFGWTLVVFDLVKALAAYEPRFGIGLPLEAQYRLRRVRRALRCQL